MPFLIIVAAIILLWLLSKSIDKMRAIKPGSLTKTQKEDVEALMGIMVTTLLVVPIATMMFWSEGSSFPGPARFMVGLALVIPANIILGLLRAIYAKLVLKRELTAYDDNFTGTVRKSYKRDQETSHTAAGAPS